MNATTTRTAGWWPRLSPDFIAAVRGHAADLMMSAALYSAVSFAAGRVFRYPFDDEVFNLRHIESKTAAQLFDYFLRAGDIHPPLPFLFNKALYELGAGPSGMRLAGLALTTLALVSFHALTLMLLRARDGAPSMQTRLSAVLLFGLCALAVAQGDALRWYPLFAAEIALVVVLYLAGTNRVAQVWAAALLGIAFSTNLIGALVALPFAIYRYGFERRAWRAGEAVLWLAGLAGAATGIVMAVALVGHRSGLVTAQLGSQPWVAIPANLLGFFGGHSLSISQAWLIVPTVVIAALSLIAAVNRRRRSDPAHLLLLLLVAVVPLPFAGFIDSRSYLYLAPAMTALIVLYVARQERAHPVRALVMTALVLVGSVAAIANVQGSTRPFKRNAALPFGEIVDFIRANSEGPTLIHTEDTTLIYILGREPDATTRCIVSTRLRESCAAPSTYATVFEIIAHNNRSHHPAHMVRIAALSSAVTTGRRKVATFNAGRDDDAALKTRLSGVPLDRHLMTIEIYR